MSINLRIARLFFCSLSLGCFFAAPLSWAITAPEPVSGGRFFINKGTRSAAQYSDLEKADYGSFDQAHYGKGVKLGIVQIEPSVGYTGEFDSNIFLRENDADSDYINRLLGGVNAYVPMKDGKYLLSAGVQSASEWFADHSKENHTDWTYQLGGEANFNAFKISMSDEFRDTTDRAGTELTQRVSRYENTLRGLLTIPFKRFFSETEISDYDLNIRKGTIGQLDRNELTVYPRFGVEIGSRTQALVEYGFTNLSYDATGDRNGQAHQGQFGIRGFLGNADLISYQIWGGAQFRHYESSNLQGYDGFVGRGEMVYRPSSISQFSLTAVRRPQESVSVGQAFYTRNEVSLRYRRQVAEKLFVSALTTIGFNHYSSGRTDFLGAPGVGVDYMLPGEMLALFSEYKFGARVSEVEGSDYNRHVVDVGIRAQV